MDENGVNTMSTKTAVSTKPTGGAPKGSHNARKHGLYTMKRAMKELSNRAIDKRTTAGRELAKWREEIVKDLGGDLSTQENSVVDVCRDTKLIVDSVFAWIVSQPTLINKRKRCVLPVVREWKDLAQSYVNHLSALGLKRVPRELTELDIARKYQVQQQIEKLTATAKGK